MNSTKTGLVVAAAFIGPGTVTTASLAGAQLGYGLVWALVFSIFATYMVQEMASRLGLHTKQGLSENLMDTLNIPIVRYAVAALIIAALGIGNAAYEGGNITGAAIGLSSVIIGEQTTWVTILALSALLLIWSNSYRFIESALIALVAVMSTVFIAVMLIAGIDLSTLIEGIKGVGLVSNSTLLLAIIGTTIVPYNLFLHAGLSAKQSANHNIKQATLSSHRTQLLGSIGIGGLVTFAIMSCAANAYYLTQTPLSTTNLANQLSPLLGEYANAFFALGLFSAGLTSAITAPLATGFAICGLFRLEADVKQTPFKLICSVIILIGAAVALSGVKPLSIILIAQASNAILLPVSIALLLFLMNKKSVMGSSVNGLMSNLGGALIVLLVSSLAVSKLVA